MNSFFKLFSSFGVVFVLLLSVNSFAAKKKPKVILATDDWCPYTCTGTNQKGNLIDLAVEALKDKYDVQIKEIPWARAKAEIKKGNVTMAVGGNKDEFEGMKTNSTPIAYVGGCFYTRKGEANWKYTGSKSFGNRVLGMVQDYEWNEDVDAYVAKYKKNPKKVVVIGGDDPYARRKELLKKKRIDIVGEDENVWNYLTKESGDAKEFEMIGCDKYVAKVDKLYAGFNADKKNAKFVDQLIADFDASLKKIIASGKDAEIFKKYGLPSLKERHKQLKKRTKIGVKI